MSISEISITDLAALPERTVIDVREADEYASGHVPGAIHIATIHASHSNITNHKKLWDIIEPYINGKYYKAERTSSMYKVNIPTKYDIKDAFIKSLSVIQKQKRTDLIITCVGLCFLIIGMYMLWHRHVSKTKVLLKNVSKH
jgi:rhodanese-related sulfurtransferase